MSSSSSPFAASASSQDTAPASPALASDSPVQVPATPVRQLSQIKTLKLASIPINRTAVFNELSAVERAAALDYFQFFYPDVERNIIVAHIRRQCHKLKSEKKRQANRALALAVGVAADAALASATATSTGSPSADAVGSDVSLLLFLPQPQMDHQLLLFLPWTSWMLQAPPSDPEEPEMDDEDAIFTKESLKSAIEMRRREADEAVAAEV
ncbi:hypothetical protein FPQ18DRAFT_308129 [Pyronema domesticum]|uniref:Uncharacterized protein n=1 Tax=Pyronema omphalodes (strain CBS 100304) TaxID=1076935 RepID=U4LCK2_PYROM|nr:hypothetical protein FPQ18DRAFT_308129 [Pyronema domesticum]CCX29799.1 Protein of unknown function [Pyronema omphalodes CBS 100304]